jgi:hypothetical protein
MRRILNLQFSVLLQWRIETIFLFQVQGFGLQVFSEHASWDLPQTAFLLS